MTGGAGAPLRVDLRLAPPTEALEAAGEALLDASERERRDRFQHAGARREFVVGRWLVRTTLAELTGAPAASLRFVIGERGAPGLPPDANPADWRFNLSHTRGLVAVAATRGAAIGVDVEDLQRRGRTVAIADRFFADAEVAELRSLPPDAQRDRFFDYWTLKESYIKARRQGLAIPLGSFAFDVSDPEAIAIGIDADLGDGPERWTFRCFDPTPRHRLALAIAARRRPVEIVTRWPAGPPAA